MKRLIATYLTRGIASIVDNLWRGIWIAFGIIIIMKLTNLFVIVAG